MPQFGSLMKAFDEDFFGTQISALDAHLRSMDRFMNSLMFDSFNAARNFDLALPHSHNQMERQGGGGNQERNHNAIGFPTTPNMNSLFTANVGNNGTSFYSSAVMSMSSGPDGKPQIYQASTSTKSGPGGVRETWRSLQDSVKGVKKMAVGHHIGERAHIIEKEQDLRSGQLEERQEFINLIEEQAEEFDREFTSKASSAMRGIANRGKQYAKVRPSSSATTIKPIGGDDKSDSEGNVNQKINVRHPKRQPSLSSSINGSRRQVSGLSVQQNQSHSTVRSNSNSTSSAKRNHNQPKESTKEEKSMNKKEISTKNK